MRKQTKLVAVLSATALLAIGAAMTSFAATGWVDEGGEWVYYDADEDMVTDSWKKSGDNWYYLDEDGYMAREKKIDEFYVNGDGVMVKNAWAELDSEEADDSDPDAPDTTWYYFGSTGKYTTGWKSINGGWYFFDEEGAMKTGWHDDDTKDATYYLGEEGEGTMRTGWQLLEERDDDDDSTSPSDSEVWYWFGSNGKLVTNEDGKKVNGKYYAFDENGKMLTGWVDTETATAPNAIEDEDRSDALQIENVRYFNEDGARAAKWLKVSALDDIDSNKWYYFKDGKAYYAGDKGTIIGYKKTDGVVDTDKPISKVTIDNKIYAFDKDGKMVSGLQELRTASNANAVYYFSNSADSDGSMKTGKQNVYIEDDDETYVYYFDTKASTKGLGISGLKDGYYYVDGRRQDAEKGSKYQIKDGKYLVNESGKVKTSGTVKDGDDNYIAVGKKGDNYVFGQGDTKAEAEADLKAELAK